MPKKKNVPVSKQSNSSSSKDLQTLAHEGTLEAVKKIKAIHDKATGEDQFLAELALEEATYLYTSPTNKAEEQDWRLLSLINKREEEQLDLFEEREMVHEKLEDLVIEQKVAEALVHQASQKEKERLQVSVNVLRDLQAMTQQRLQELEQHLHDDEQWIKTAKELVTTKKYRSMPEEFRSFIQNEEDMCDECDDEEDISCPYCQSSDVEAMD